VEDQLQNENKLLKNPGTFNTQKTLSNFFQDRWTFVEKQVSIAFQSRLSVLFWNKAVIMKL